MESINRIYDWSSSFGFATWSKEASHKVANASSSWSSSASHGEGQSLWTNANGMGMKDGWTQNFPHAFMTDYRTPLFTFEFNGKELGFYSISFMYWTEMLVIMLFEAMVAVAFSVLVYRMIVKKQGTAVAYLVGFGLVIPFWVFFPSMVVDWMGVRNKLYRFCMAAVTPSLCVFRTTEAMYGFSPEHAITSQRPFMVYFGSPMVAKFDKEKGEFVKASNDYLWEKLFLVARSFAFLGMVYSIFVTFPEYLPKLGAEYDEAEWYSIGHLVSKKNMYESFLYTAIFQYTLATSGDGGNFVSSLITGYEMEPFMTNPMGESETLAEFWGKRWNKLIQTLLKRGIFKPLRAMFPKWVAMAGCFTVSGIFHEWLMMIIFAPLPEDVLNENCAQNQCYKLIYGSALAFFMWMGVLIACEMAFLPRSYFKKSPFFYKVVMGCAAMVGCPFFMAPYVHTSFFTDGFLGYVMVQPVLQQ